MGSCFSKKQVSSSSTTPAPLKPPIEATIRVEEKKLEVKIAKQKEEEVITADLPVKAKEEEKVLLPKKEVFVIKHRKSHDRERPTPNPSPPQVAENDNVVEIVANSGVRASSCTKEEVDAILIQCGRLSRSNSSGKAISSGRKYSGSKRNFDFDHPDNDGRWTRKGKRSRWLESFVENVGEKVGPTSPCRQFDQVAIKWTR